MDRIERAAVISCLADKLRHQESLCGETHIQKAVYVLQELLKVPLEFDFVMYKHGPFSFDLRDYLTSLRADGLLELLVEAPYGPSFVTTEQGKKYQSLYSQTLYDTEDALDFVADRLGPRKAPDLEKLATALFVTLDPDVSENERAEKLYELKRHISQTAAQEAVKELDEIKTEASRCLAAAG